MAVPFPQHDLLPDVTSGSDAWDDGLVGQILTADYFTAPAPPATGRMKVWTGSAWVAKPVKVWSGSAWVEKPVKFWNGSAWV